ncbi:MAG: carbonic anhydrase [Acidobacteriaceae bacterium]
MDSSTAVEPNVTETRKELTPDATLRLLMEGNERFVSGKMTGPGDNLAGLRRQTVRKQEPFATVLSCVDSRVPVELVFDQTIGRLLVARVAGNIVSPEILGSLEFGAALLGTKVILVLGHANCGAVTAAMRAEAAPGLIGSWFAHIQPAVDRAGGDLETAVKENAKIQAGLLAKSSPLLAGLVKEGKLKIVAGYYDLATGRVSLLQA